jgi:hypothetical protein
MKQTGTRRLLATAICLLILSPGISSAQSPLVVEATATDDNAPPHNVLCTAESAQVFECRIWSPTGAAIERARPTTEGVSLLDIAQVTGAETTVALALVVGGAGTADLTQQRIRNSLAVALSGIGTNAFVATYVAGAESTAFSQNGADMQRRLIDQALVEDPDALSIAVSGAVEALSRVEGRPRALVLAGSAADEFSRRAISRLTRRLQAEGIALTVLLLPSEVGEAEAALHQLPFANLIDTGPTDGALSNPQLLAFPAFVAPTVRLRLGHTAGLTADGVDLAAQFSDGSRTEFRVSQGEGAIASIGSFGPAGIGALALLPRNVGTFGGMQGYLIWIITIVAGLLIALYGIFKPRPRKEQIDVASLRQAPMTIEDVEIALAAPAGAAAPVAEPTEVTSSASTGFADVTAMHDGGPGAAGKSIGRITFSGTGRVETLRDGVTRIGRLGPPDNDIVVNETHVSRRHAEIFSGGDGSVCIRNLSLDGASQSRRENPIFVNGAQIEGDTVLTDGDEIRLASIGDTRFKVSLEPLA